MTDSSIVHVRADHQRCVEVTMIPAARRQRIIEMLEERRAVRVSSLSKDFMVSEMTIRRDLDRLAREGLLSRTHGGAVLKRHMSEEPRYVDSVLAHTEEKQRIARHAATMIEPGETVFLSAGTTAAQVLRHVSPDLVARVVTDNVGALTEAQGSRLEVVLLGGVYSTRSHAVQGSLAAEMVERFHASKMLFGVDGIDFEEGLTTPSVELASVERTMVRQTRGDVIVLADSSKLGVVADVVICPLNQAHVVIADSGISDEMRTEFERIGLQCIVV